MAREVHPETRKKGEARMYECPLCKRVMVSGLMEGHHLQTQRKDRLDTEDICRECHKTIHGLFSQTELRDPRTGLDTLEGILANERFQKALRFIRKVPAGEYMKMRESNGRKRRR